VVSKEGHNQKPLVRKDSSSSSNDEASHDCSLSKDPVTLSQKASDSMATTGGYGVTEGGHAGKRCRVLFSYSPAHEDELELQLNDIINFMGEVEEGWWHGQLRGRLGIFPSNFVEMISEDDLAKSTSDKVTSDLTVTRENKKNAKNMKGEFNLPSLLRCIEKCILSLKGSSKISNLIKEAEAKSKPTPVEAHAPTKAGNDFSSENANPNHPVHPILVARAGSKEPRFTNPSANAGPRLPPKPGKGFIKYIKASFRNPTHKLSYIFTLSF
jgi:hypothetical protein